MQEKDTRKLKCAKIDYKIYRSTKRTSVDLRRPDQYTFILVYMNNGKGYN